MTEVPRILLHNDETDLLHQRLHDAFPDADIRTCNSYAAVAETLSAFHPDIVYSVRFDGSRQYPREAMFGSNGPRWIANGGVGTDHFGQWDSSKTTVTNAAGVAADVMAEYVLGGFLHFTLGIPTFQADKAQRAWKPRTVRPMKGKTLLIVGLGSTGRAIAKRAKAFGLEVIGTRAWPQPMEHVDEVFSATDLPELLPRADFIAVATPLTPQTRGLIGTAEIQRMKKGTILADVSRGHVIHQTALLGALQTGVIEAAILDVFEVEPLPDNSALWQLDNVILSPHCSSVYQGWELASFDLFLGNLRRWIDGDPLLNVVDPVRGY